MRIRMVSGFKLALRGEIVSESAGKMGSTAPADPESIRTENVGISIQGRT